MKYARKDVHPYLGVPKLLANRLNQSTTIVLLDDTKSPTLVVIFGQSQITTPLPHLVLWIPQLLGLKTPTPELLHDAKLKTARLRLDHHSRKLANAVVAGRQALERSRIEQRNRGKLWHGIEEGSMYKGKRQRFEGAKEKKKTVKKQTEQKKSLKVIEATREGIRKPIEEVVK
jgi:hypothetical protein